MDRCGEALVRLENSTDEGWLPGEIVPQGGVMRNFRLGMGARFSAESMTVEQMEYISFDHFQDQTCKIFEVLWNTFDIDTILTPSFRCFFQVGFDELKKASEYALGLSVCKPAQVLLSTLGGRESAVSYALCTEKDEDRDGQMFVQRRRVDFQTVRQERQPDFDQRVVQRLALLPVGQQKALGDLMKLRRQHRTLTAAAVQFEVENSWEGELLVRTFDLKGFLGDSWDWARKFRKDLEALRTAVS